MFVGTGGGNFLFSFEQQCLLWYSYSLFWHHHWDTLSSLSNAPPVAVQCRITLFEIWLLFLGSSGRLAVQGLWSGHQTQGQTLTRTPPLAASVAFTTQCHCCCLDEVTDLTNENNMFNSLNLLFCTFFFLADSDSYQLAALSRWSWRATLPQLCLPLWCWRDWAGRWIPAWTSWSWPNPFCWRTTRHCSNTYTCTRAHTYSKKEKILYTVTASCLHNAKCCPEASQSQNYISAVLIKYLTTVDSSDVSIFSYCLIIFFFLTCSIVCQCKEKSAHPGPGSVRKNVVFHTIRANEKKSALSNTETSSRGKKNVKHWWWHILMTFILRLFCPRKIRF